MLAFSQLHPVNSYSRCRIGASHFAAKELSKNLFTPQLAETHLYGQCH